MIQEQATFAAEFSIAVERAGLEQVLGIRSLTSAVRPSDMIECTEGKSNIMFSRNEVRTIPLKVANC